MFGVHQDLASPPLSVVATVVPSVGDASGDAGGDGVGDGIGDDAGDGDCDAVDVGDVGGGGVLLSVDHFAAAASSSVST